MSCEKLDNQIINTKYKPYLFIIRHRFLIYLAQKVIFATGNSDVLPKGAITTFRAKKL